MAAPSCLPICVLILLSSVAVTFAATGPVVIAGATGKTGMLAYHQLKSKNVGVRALVRSATKARDVLGCTACDEAEGIFVSDLTRPETLVAPMQGAGALLIASSAAPICDPFPHCHFPPGGSPLEVDWKGAKAMMETFANATQDRGFGKVVLISTMGTTRPDDSNTTGHITFYKLTFEADLMASGLPFTIVKPCGLIDSPGAKRQLVVGHNDDLHLSPPLIPRADVARVCVAALQSPELSDGLRFDLCSKAGSPTTEAELPKVLRAARFPWDRHPAELVV